MRALLCSFALSFASLAHAAPQGESALPHPILFVTQFPITGDFASIGSVFANHRGTIAVSGRGGDLYIRYTDGTLRNLTQEAGYGNAGFQGATSIAVRDPAVHWSGTKAVFSMVIGAPQQFLHLPYYWQLYEVTGLGAGETVSIVKVQNQPADYNNVQATYASDGTLVFVSDRPRGGERHLYPQHDEYESTATPTGLWHLDPASGALKLLQHSPSGSFTPIVDSFGRIVFTRWDHLQRDQQHDAGDRGTFNWASEEPNAAKSAGVEVFPEVRIPGGGTTQGYTINHFFPWQLNQDGTEEETLNHIGRHELHSYFDRSFNNDSNLVTFAPGGRTNPRSIRNMLYIREDPLVPGRFLGVDAPEFYTHGSGQLIAIGGAPAVNPAAMQVQWLTSYNTGFFHDGTVPADFTGHYRNPLPLSDGRTIASHTAQARQAGNDGTRSNPVPRYDFRLQLLDTGGDGFLRAVAPLTNGISKSVSFYDPDFLVSYAGNFWELSPVEVRARTAPPTTASSLKTPEEQAFALEQVEPTVFRRWLVQRGLAVAVMRNVTTRDVADKQQPYNLRVPGGAQTVGSGGTLYDIAHMQFFQGDQIRGIGGIAAPTAGRRVIAQVLHDPVAVAENAPNPTGPAGSVPIASDGSVALFLPTRRAMAWQATAPNGTPVVRERYWITFQPGEIRACDGCHGVNQSSQSGNAAAQNVSIAFRELLGRFRATGPLFFDDFE